MAIILMILSFIWWWPLGLLVLGFLIARRKFVYGRHLSYAGDRPMFDGDYVRGRWDLKMVRLQEKMDRVCTRMDRARSRGDWFAPASSGNRAFDDYRSDTLKRLEDEQREFKDFLERLRFAKDRSEFDQFMAARRPQPFDPNATPEAPREEPRN